MSTYERETEIKSDIGEKEKKTYNVSIVLDSEDYGQDPVELKYRFKEPSPIQFNRYIKEMSKDVVKAGKNLVLSNVFAQDRDKLIDDMEKYPGLILTLTPKFMGMMGYTDNVTFHRI